MKCIFTLAHSLVVFSVVWYILGHIWIFRITVTSDHANKVCMTNVSRAVIILLMLEYLIALWHVCSRIWNAALVLRWLQQVIQRRLDEFPNDHGPRLRLFENTDSLDDETDQLHVVETLPNVDNDVVSSAQFTKIHTASLFIGLILLIALSSTMLTLYINLPESISQHPTALPEQCFSYTTDSDSSRLYTYTSSCCGADHNLAAGWYRFTGGGNARLIITPLRATSRCGSSYPGWWNGTLPTMMGATTVGNVCFYDGNLCSNPISPIMATRCDGYYVFYLIPVSCCSLYRYCTIH